MRHYRATNLTTQEVIEYDDDLPQPEHLSDAWRLEDVGEAVASPEAGEVPPVVDPAAWRIYVGAFFDRFGDAKIPILASENTIVQALIKDASVRQYIGLVERKEELTQMLGLLQTLVPGIALDVTAILETAPTDEERWNG